MYENLLSTITPKDLVLTPNRRLSAFLRHQYCELQLANGNAAWVTPDILPLTSWLERCWQQLQITDTTAALTLLAPHQEQLIWEQLIRASEMGKNLLRVRATAMIALQAWQLTRQWHIALTDSSFSLAENSLIWTEWAQRFKVLCQEQAWLDTATLPSWLAEKFIARQLMPPERLMLVGFDEINPQLQQLLAILRQQGTAIIESNHRLNNCQLARVDLLDTEAELYTMARWAHHLWQQGKRSIGCVIPNLSQIRQQVVSVFTEVFTPEAHLPGYHAVSLPFNLSAGAKLKDFPIISTAFEILSLKQEMKLTSLGALLRSPYLGFGETEMTMRARLDAKLRSYGEPVLGLSLIMLNAKKMGILQLANSLAAYLQLERSIPEFQTPAEWAALFAKQLSLVGWPGQRVLDSLEHQLIDIWSKLLTQLAHLSLVSEKMSRFDAIQQLQNLAASQEFQAKSAIAPVQILGLLEAAGLSFSHLWIMGLHDKDWPSIPNPNPFIPLSLQRQLKLPHASSEREFNYCRLLLERLLHSAPEVIVSCPQYLEDQQVQASPFLTKIKPIATDNLILSTFKPYAELIFDSAKIELLADDFGLSLRQEETIKGGAAIFKSQAACPFQAFARFRLNAQALDSPESGLSPLERGSLLHKSLEVLWNTLKNQKELLNYQSSELEMVIDKALEIALLEFIQKRPLTFRQRFTQLEKRRLQALLTDWLELEKNRTSFTVKFTERADKYVFADIPLVLKSDRIDQLENGSLIIIDYKTGQPSISDWLGDRPEEPQLPLYCVTSNLPIEGILFAKIRSDKKQFMGITAADYGIPGTFTPGTLKGEEHPPNWDELVKYWRMVLTQLGQKFSAGEATVDPKDGLKTCQNCKLQAMCRVYDKEFPLKSPLPGYS